MKQGNQHVWKPLRSRPLDSQNEIFGHRNWSGVFRAFSEFSPHRPVLLWLHQKRTRIFWRAGQMSDGQQPLPGTNPAISWTYSSNLGALWKKWIKMYFPLFLASAATTSNGSWTISASPADNAMFTTYFLYEEKRRALPPPRRRRRGPNLSCCWSDGQWIEIDSSSGPLFASCSYYPILFVECQLHKIRYNWCFTRNCTKNETNKTHHSTYFEHFCFWIKKGKISDFFSNGTLCSTLHTLTIIINNNFHYCISYRGSS